ncbi:MFS transporter [Burkholderia gladioli]|uniref:MFS transporter n=1 Tax=Burkholderia gladioli TaxID=28095 RepID=UPI00064B5BCE|nr:MFS transporter [Burkholderia gladioli]MDA0569450.1 MFS transporter [Burkholderia gladioli]MDA0598057.1 MFS transporter [Burkholderia gladioli]
MELNAARSPDPAPYGAMSEAAQENRICRGLALRILPIFMFAYLASYIDRVNVSFAKLQLSQELGFTDAVFGFGAGTFALGYVLFEVPSNMILQRVGAKRWLTRIILAWAIVSALTTLVSTPKQFYIMRYLLGVTEAGLVPGVVYYISQSFPRFHRTRILSVFYAALPLAGLIGSPLSGFIMEFSDGLLDVSGWKWMLIVEAIPAFGAALLCWKYLEDDVTLSRHHSESDRAYLIGILAEDRAISASASHTEMFASWLFWIFGFIYFLDVFGIYGYTLWAPTIIKSLGVERDTVIGLVAALPNAVAVAVMLITGRRADRHRERRMLLAGLFFMAAAGLALSLLWHDNLWLSVLALCIANAGLLSIPPVFWGMPTAVLGPASIASGIAWISAIGNIGGFFGPYVVGQLKQSSGGFALPVFCIIACLLLGLVLTLLLPKHLVDR